MELLDEAKSLIETGDQYIGEGMKRKAFVTYMNALYAAGAVFVYKDTGMLMPDDELKRFLGSRIPEVFEVISRCESLGVDGADRVRAEALRLIEMAERYWKGK